jgi:hypothetical protein
MVSLFAVVAGWVENCIYIFSLEISLRFVNLLFTLYSISSGKEKEVKQIAKVLETWKNQSQEV